MMYSFACKTCGHLADSASAGERAYPGSCQWCGKGVRFDPDTGVKTFLDAENWDILSDLDAKGLEKLPQRLTAEDVEVHVPSPVVDTNRVPQHFDRAVEENMSIEDAVQ